MSITTDALAGKIIKAPLNGSPIPVPEIPEGMVPFYSGAVLILAGEQAPDGDVNLNIKGEFNISVIGDAVVLSQKTWHNIIGD